jgi:zinc protease
MKQSFPAPIRTVEGITEYQLSNGLTVLLFPDASTQNVTVNITYLVGSRHEGRGEGGMAHLLEHMLFKGTPDHPNVKATFQDHGAVYNATTGFDRTNYFSIVSATDQNLEVILKLEADRMINSLIRQEDFDVEMIVVRNEFEMGENNPIQILHDQIFACAYQWHNYGKTTIGNLSDIERVPLVNLKAFYKKYYRPDNAVLIVAGNFKLEKTQEWIMRYFDTLGNPAYLLEDTYTEEPTQEGPREVRLTRVGDVAQMAVAYHIPAASHPDFAILDVLSEVLVNEPSGLLYQSFVQSGIASELFSMVHALKEPGLFMIFLRPSYNDQISVVLEKMLTQLENLTEVDITPENVERAKIRISTQNILISKSSNDLALELSESISQGDYRLFFYIRDQIKHITVDDVLRVARTYLVENNRTTGKFIPTMQPKFAIIPPVPDVKSLLEGYCSAENIHIGEEFEATTENIDAHTSRDVLASTIKTALLSKMTRGKTNIARFVFPFGNEANLSGKRAALQLIPTLLSRGTKDLTLQQVEDKLDKLQSSLDIYPAQPGIVVVDIASDQYHLPEVIVLAADLMQKPRFSQEEFVLVQKRELADLKEIRMDPMQIGMIELHRLKNPFPVDSIHYIPTVDEVINELQAITFEDIQDVYSQFYGANHLEVAMVGSFDLSITSTVEKYFGNWSSSAAYNRVMTPYVPALNELRQLVTPDKKMAIVALGVNFAMRNDDIHYPAIMLANYILGEDMKSRLMRRLREQEGISYEAGSSLTVSQYHASADLNLYATCPANKADFALQLMQAEYDHWLDKGVTDQELLESKQSFQFYFNNLLANDKFILQALSTMLGVNRTFGYYTQLLNQVKQLNTEDIRKALDIFLHNATVASVKAGDF